MGVIVVQKSPAGDIDRSGTRISEFDPVAGRSTTRLYFIDVYCRHWYGATSVRRTFGRAACRCKRARTIRATAIGSCGVRGPAIRLIRCTTYVKQAHGIRRAETEAERRFFKDQITTGWNRGTRRKDIRRMCVVVVEEPPARNVYGGRTCIDEFDPVARCPTIRLDFVDLNGRCSRWRKCDARRNGGRRNIGENRQVAVEE